MTMYGDAIASQKISDFDAGPFAVDCPGGGLTGTIVFNLAICVLGYLVMFLAV